jgi:anti-sigma factor RsiW
MNELPHPCEKWAEPISMAAAGCLSPDEEREIRGHIETCSDCRERFRQLSELCGVLAELRLPSNSAETTVVQRVMSAVEQAVLERQQLAPRVRVGASNNQLLERIKNMILAHKRLSAAAA